MRLPADWKIRLFGRLERLEETFVAIVKASQKPYRLAPPAVWLAVAALATALLFRSRAPAAARALSVAATLAAFVVVVTAG
ncbi:MAG: hypothetical protein ACT4PV_04385 [Planctomycetaceae bacterium]